MLYRLSRVKTQCATKLAKISNSNKKWRNMVTVTKKHSTTPARRCFCACSLLSAASSSLCSLRQPDPPLPSPLPSPSTPPLFSLTLPLLHIFFSPSLPFLPNSYLSQSLLTNLFRILSYLALT
jgi:hypothetical protein